MTLMCLRHHLPPKPNEMFTVGETASDTNNPLLCAARVKGQLLTMSGPDSPDIVWMSYKRTVSVCCHKSVVSVTALLTALCIWLQVMSNSQ